MEIEESVMSGAWLVLRREVDKLLTRYDMDVVMRY